MTRVCFTGISGLLLPLIVLAQEAVAPSAAQPAAPLQPPPAVVQTEPESPVIVQVAGVETLTDYATVGRLLGAVEGVRRVDVTEAQGVTVTFRVLVRGGGAALDRALESSAQLARSESVGGRLLYEYRR